MNDIIIFSNQIFETLSGAKNNSFLIFDECIDLSKYCDEDLISLSKKYKLMGTINHLGSINNGFYFVNIKIESFWYEFNDSIGWLILHLLK